MLYAVCPSPIFNSKSRAIPGHIFITKTKFSFILVPDASLIFARQFITLCYMPYASRSRAIMKTKNHTKTHSKIIRSSYLPLLRGSPCERGVTLAQFRVNYSSPPLSSGGPLLVVAWFAHAQSDRYFSIEEKYQSVSFLSSEARTDSASFCK